MVMYAFNRGKHPFIWTWYIEVLDYRIKGGQLGEYAVDGNAFLSYIFYILFSLALTFWEIANVYVGFPWM